MQEKEREGGRRHLRSVSAVKGEEASRELHGNEVVLGARKEALKIVVGCERRGSRQAASSMHGREVNLGVVKQSSSRWKSGENEKRSCLEP